MVEKTTLRQIIQKLIAINKGKSESTQAIVEDVLEDFETWWRHGLDFHVRHIRPSDLAAWLAIQERRLRNSSYNRFASVLKQLLELAVMGSVIAESPFEAVTTKWKKPQIPDRTIPTPEQFQVIVDSIRSQRYTLFAESTADLVEFLGLTGLGQAEASSLRWGHVDFFRKRLQIRRHKTDTKFFVPIYPHLHPLLEKLRINAKQPLLPESRVFKINDAEKVLTAVCERLGLPHFSQINLRHSLIMRLWKSGVDKKLIARWQGHQDGGQLVMQTYTEVSLPRFGGHDWEERNNLTSA